MLWIILIRIFGPLIILKYPLFGALFAIFLDFFDLNLLTAIDPNNLNYYQPLDKMLDIFYLSLELYVLFFWKNRLVRDAALLLFIYRIIGVILFNIVGDKAILVIYPNVFEPFYLIYLLQQKFLKKDFFVTKSRVLILVIVLLLPKLVHEYFLHINTAHPWSENKYVKQIINRDY